MFTRTPPSGSCASRRSAKPSTVSCTGISSSRVTRCTAVSGDRSTRITACAWEWIGPNLARPATSELTFRNLVSRPVGGASITIASYARRPSGPLRRAASQALPVSRTSRTPGAMVVAKSTKPTFCSAFPARPSL